MNNTWAILVAGGTGIRFGGKTPKQFQNLAGRRVLDYSLDLFASLTDIAGVVLLLPSEFMTSFKQELESRGLNKIRVGLGGLTRQKSVQNGLQLVDPQAEWILVHDVARPLVTAELVGRTLAGARETGCAVTALAISDTLKRGDDAQFVEKTVSRNRLYSIQTPQAFSKKLLAEALHWAEERGLDATDEAGLVEQMGHRVKLVEGSVINFKITRSQDLEIAEAFLQRKNQEKTAPNKSLGSASDPIRGVSETPPRDLSGGTNMLNEIRIGEGYDVHAYADGRKLILGGVEIPFAQGLLGHSDADALLHAACDALLGAVAEGDLGRHFPDTDPQFKGISSRVLLQKVGEILRQKGYECANLDATIICQMPKLAPFLASMRENIATELRIPVERVSVKATTEEGLGFTGTLQGLAARAVVLVRKLTL